MVHVFDVLGDPVRRRILELLADGELTSGAIAAVVQAEFGISQPGVSQHLRVLRESGLATVRAEGAHRLYAVDSATLREIDLWLERFRRFWTERLDALGTEFERQAQAAGTEVEQQAQAPRTACTAGPARNAERDALKGRPTDDQEG